jgi:hypothetical protein
MIIPGDGWNPIRAIFGGGGESSVIYKTRYQS